MLLTEFDEELFAKTIRDEGREEGRKEGRKEGREEGEDRLGQLNLRLLRENRISDMERVQKDRAFRNLLYQQYGL